MNELLPLSNISVPVSSSILVVLGVPVTVPSARKLIAVKATAVISVTTLTPGIIDVAAATVNGTADNTNLCSVFDELVLRAVADLSARFS